VVSVNGDLVSATFSYDANGNQTGATGIGRTITYSSYNKPATITQGANSISFSDDVDHQRFKQVAATGTSTATTYYFDAFGVHSEVTGYSSGAWQWNHYLMVGGSMVGVHIERSGGSVNFRYFHQDHLGSIAVITDENGALAEPRDGYDAWGKRRNPNGTDDPTGSLTSLTPRGFTGQEMLASVGLVHLNGRVYDPYLGRMTSADPVVGDPLNGQTWNRYSYVYNNPLAYTDPTGYCPVCIRTVKPPQAVSQSSGIQLIGSIFQIAASAICMAMPGCPMFMPLIAAANSAFFAGVTSGSWSVALRAGVVTLATAGAFKLVGGMTGHNPGFDNPLFPINVAGHALVGCGSAVASGQKCGPGALAAAVTAFAGPMINGEGFSVQSLMLNSALGGFASVAGGGKFANGALTAAFGYLFNQAANVAQGRAAEELWAQSVLSDGGEIMGRNLKYYVVDEQGNPILRDGKRMLGELDGMSRSRDGLIDVGETKNGKNARFEGTQLERSEYVREGRIRFYGEAARQWGVEGQTLSEVAGGRPIAFRLYVGPLGAPRAVRQWLRFRFRGGVE
jgi:RHS repeat-associated protein